MKKGDIQFTQLLVGELGFESESPGLIEIRQNARISLNVQSMLVAFLWVQANDFQVVESCSEWNIFRDFQ